MRVLQDLLDHCKVVGCPNDAECMVTVDLNQVTGPEVTWDEPIRWQEVPVCRTHAQDVAEGVPLRFSLGR